ncbi:unnamed protein product [Gadus morhua 'NCC']
MSVVENGILMALICLDQSLKTPKYIAVFHLAFVDVVGSSALVPKVIDTFWFDHNGFSGIPHVNYYYLFLLVLYIVSVVENGVVMALICFDQSLKTPKYIAVFNLAFVDVVGSSALVPKVIDTFWFDHNLKTPKYIAVFNLAFVDVVGSSALVPKVIDTFWFDHKMGVCLRTGRVPVNRIKVGPASGRRRREI